MLRPMTALAVLALAAGPAAAQPGAPAPSEAEAPVPNSEVVERLAAMLEESFVFPEAGSRYAAMLRARLAGGGYAGLADPAAFAERVTADLQAVHADGHLRVFPPEAAGSGPRRRGGPPGPERAIGRSGWIADGVAYLELRGFPGDRQVVDRIGAFMAAHRNARALILDIRGHGGGGLAEMDAIFPWLFSAETELVRMDTRRAVEERDGSPIPDTPALRRMEGTDAIVRRGHFAIPGDEPSALRTAPVYLLTSGRSASAAEHFALSLKRTGRATLIGETTRGAGHYGGAAPLPGGYRVFMPVGRTYDPDTGQGWEGKGVAPDITVPAADALEEALRRIGVAPGDRRPLPEAAS